MQSSKIIGILIEDLRIEHHTESAYVIEQEMTALGYTCITLSTGRRDEKKADYIRILEQLLNHEIQFISVGARRDQFLTKGAWL